MSGKRKSLEKKSEECLNSTVSYLQGKIGNCAIKSQNDFGTGRVGLGCGNEGMEK